MCIKRAPDIVVCRAYDFVVGRCLFEGSVRDGLLLHSRYADLVVVSQPDGSDRFGVEHGLLGNAPAPLLIAH